MLTIDQLLDKIKGYNPRANLEVVRQAFDFANKMHQGQKRASGDPYLSHPMAVAMILADMRLDVPTLSAGVLHDTVEDTPATKAEIVKIFGDEIALLVDGVTKLSKLNFSSSQERQAESFRKMVLAMAQDIRVLLIKLADRLHNMRTLEYMPEAKQRATASETMEIYAPLANRLGMQWMKLELEDLAFRYINSESFAALDRKMRGLKKDRQQYMSRVEKEVRDHVMGGLKHFEIKGRMKNLYSVYKKMNDQSIIFEQVHDLIAFRVLVDTVAQCYEILGHIHALWKPIPGRFKDYVAMPKPNNYQSLHTTVICLDGERVEFQIRTYEMHETAEKGIAAHWKYKESGQIKLEDEEKFHWLRQLVSWQQELADSVEFLDAVKLDLFASDVFLFTPKGDVIDLPHGSTPIDFAYAIHSEVGNRCVGARVNDRMVSLNYKLRSGDTVEILTNPHHRPSKDWLAFVKTSRAHARIRAYIRQEQRERSVALGSELFGQACTKIGLAAARVVKLPPFAEWMHKNHLKDVDTFYAFLAYGKKTAEGVLAKIFPAEAGRAALKPAEEGVIRQIFKKVSQRTKNLVVVDGIDDLLVSFGKCCSPLQGDPIVGFITRGRGVTVHQLECPKVLASDPERRVKVVWNVGADVVNVARVRITCIDKPGLLAKISQEISERGVNIARAQIRTTKDEKAINMMDLAVKDRATLYTLMKSLEKIDGVIAVERMRSG